MKFLIILLALTLIAGCGTTSTVDPVEWQPASDLRFIDTLRELDERCDALLGAAKFQSQRKELTALADKALHAHSERSDDFKKWRDSVFPNAAKDVAMPACGDSDYGISPAGYLQIVDRLIAHRECATSFAREALAGVRSSNAKKLIEEAVADYESELQQLRGWSTAWR